MTEEDIKEINGSSRIDSWDQGIYKEPYGIKTGVKELVIYQRHEIGGVSGGSCWDSSDPQPYYNSTPMPEFTVLDLVLEKICPNISYLNYKKVLSLIHNSEKTDYEYYGNYSEYSIRYIVLSELEELVKTFKS